MDNSPRLSGEEWQKWADSLLQRYYGPGEYQRVPDNQKGDAGIEGFTIATGHAYQAYGPEEPLSTDERYKKLRQKTSDDIKKFIENKDKLAPLFGEVKIKRWILFVPYFDSKDIIDHASKKTKEVIAANLPYVDNANFRVVIEQEEAFAVERDQLINVGNDKLLIIPGAVSPEAIADWVGTYDVLVTRLTKKLERLPSCQNEDQLRKLRDNFIKHFLEGQNVLEDLRQYPEIYESIRRAKSERERYLATENMFSVASPPERLKEALDQFRLTLSEIRGVSTHTIDAVIYEAIADWLIRCPLDFPSRVLND